MAIGTNYRNDYIGNNATSTYPYGFKIFAATDLAVSIRPSGSVSDTPLNYPTDFTVTGVGTPGGGNIVLTAGNLATGTKLAIRRVRPLTQSTTLSNQSAYQADVHENAFDGFVMLNQQQQDQLNRSLHVQDTVDPSTVSTVLPAPVPGQVLAWNGSGTGFTNVPTTGVTVANFTSKIRIADVFTGTDASAKIIAAINDLPASGGTVDARGLEGAQAISTSIVIPKNVTVLLGAATFTVASGVSTAACQLTGACARLIGLGAAQATGGGDPATNAALGSTNLVGSGLGSTVDMVRVAIPAGQRADLSSSILPSPVVSGIWINMGNSGRHGLYLTSVHTGLFRDVQVFNIADGGNGIEFEGDLSTSTFLAECYYNVFEQIVVQPRASNVTGYGIHLNATHGELAWNTFRNIRSSGNIVTGGGLAAIFFETGTADQHSINHTDLNNCYFGNSTDAAGSYGVKLKATGTYPSQSGGRIVDLSIRDTLIERLFAATHGIAIGGVSSTGPDVRSGTGIGCVTLFNTGASANWAVATIDRANMGQTYIEVGGFTNPGDGQPSYRISGTLFGSNAPGLYFDPTMIASANNDALFGVSSAFNVNANGKTGLNVYAHNMNWGTYTPGGGTVDRATNYYGDAPTFATSNYFIYGNSGDSRLNGRLGLGADPGSVTLRLSRTEVGPNAQQFRLEGTSQGNADNQTLYGGVVITTFNTGGKAITEVNSWDIDGSTAFAGGGSVARANSLLIAPPSGAGINNHIALLVGSNRVSINAGTGVPSHSAPVGSVYLRTDAPDASHAFYICYPADTWNALTAP